MSLERAIVTQLEFFQDVVLAARAGSHSSLAQRTAATRAQVRSNPEGCLDKVRFEGFYPDMSRVPFPHHPERPLDPWAYWEPWVIERRFFEFLYAELSLAMGRRISRYDLWLRVSEAAIDPSLLPRDEKKRFIDQCLDSVLVRERKALAPRARQRLLRRVLSFDPRYPTPEECLTRLVGAAS